MLNLLPCLISRRFTPLSIGQMAIYCQGIYRISQCIKKSSTKKRLVLRRFLDTTQIYFNTLLITRIIVSADLLMLARASSLFRFCNCPLALPTCPFGSKKEIPCFLYLHDRLKAIHLSTPL